MTWPATLATVFVAALLIRQLFVLSAAVRTRRFLRHGWSEARDRQSTEVDPRFFVIVPVLREAAIIEEVVAHFEALTAGDAALLMIVTTAREAAEAATRETDDTIALVKELAGEHSFVHLHYPDPLGLKGDQLNFAAATVRELLEDGEPSQKYLVCYDADSRPPLEALTQFKDAIGRFPDAEVFHQSARFELRSSRGRHRGLLGWFSRTVCDGGALRANRFVAGFELPRLLNRTAGVSAIKRAACSYVYAHVTTHGLCVRLPLVLAQKFPERSPLEDMQYSFYIGSRNVPIIALPSLDCSEVPDSIRGQVSQAARWFVGPARAGQYIKEPATQSGWRARLLMLSALGSSAEWLGCAVVPVLMLLLLALSSGPLLFVTYGMVGVYGVQLVVVESTLGASDSLGRRVARVLACPVAAFLHGIGGFIGAARLLTGRTSAGKTERVAL
jgi:hypothetical protein